MRKNQKTMTPANAVLSEIQDSRIRVQTVKQTMARHLSAESQKNARMGQNVQHAETGQQRRDRALNNTGTIRTTSAKYSVFDRSEIPFIGSYGFDATSTALSHARRNGRAHKGRIICGGYCEVRTPKQKIATRSLPPLDRRSQS